jgi:hypothetical protein
MKRSAPLLLTGAIVAAAAAWAPTHASAALCGQPSVSGVTTPFAAAGATVTITGSNFTSLACNTSANIGGVNLTQNQMSVSNSAISFTAQPGMHGGIQVSEAGVGGSNTSNGNVAFYTAPTVSGLSTTTPTAGQGISVGGAGFDFTLPSGYEQVSARYLSSNGSATCAGASAGVSSDTAIAVSAPGHYCNGPLALTISAPSDLGNPSVSQVTVWSGQPGHVAVQATVNQLPGSPVTAGGTVNVTGSGFGTGGSATVDGGNVGSTWSDTSVGVSVPDTAVNGSTVALTRSDGTAIPPVPGTLTVNARVDTVSPTSASPGDTVTIAGGGFGTTPGTVTIGSAPATVSSWSPTSIVITLPAAAQTGSLTISPHDTGAPATQPSITVVPKLTFKPTTGGATGPSGSSSNSNANANAKPLTPAQVQQVTAALSAPPPPLPSPVVGGTPPPLPSSHPTNGPVALSLKTSATTAKPGKTVPFTVRLKAYGNPVANAPVQMVVAYEPAPDATITPASGVTDANGQFHGVVHLSKTPGEMIILARTGEFSDEVRLVGSTVTLAAGGAGSQSGTGLLQRNLPILVVVLATLLLLVGIGLRVGLWVASKDSLRAALVRERFTGVSRHVRSLVPARFLPLRLSPLRQRLASGGGVQPGGDASTQVGVPAEDEAAVALQHLGADAAPDESKERIGVGS